ncbi:hypothetical protein B7463_g6713, partial [Scytalidium lignicola]
MRLIKSRTLELVEFTKARIPPYAILSHTWDNDPENEISFQDMQSLVLPGPVILSAGEKKENACMKIKECCHKALNDGFEYVWVDTCCINKTSSAEVSEAINSMYRWYQQSDVCYVYLSDVKSGLDSASFLESRWFERGWTLQELIAPSSLIFFNNTWADIGTKSSCQKDISQKTGIPSTVLLGLKDPDNFSIAQRMSWASNRETTKVEDIAYCLMGIFGINMSLIYGEGDRAFIRLQEKIIKTSTDQSIFAWTSDRWEDRGGGLLASSPASFSESGDIVLSNLQTGIGFSLTGDELSVKVPVAETWHGEIIDPMIEVEHSFIGILDCETSNDSTHVLGIHLEKITSTSQHFVRSDSNFLEKIQKSKVDFSQSSVSNIYVRQQRQRQSEGPVYNQLDLRVLGFKEHNIFEKERYCTFNDAHGKRPFQILDKTHTTAVLYADSDGMEFVVLFEWNEGLQYINIAGPVKKSETLQEIIHLLRFERVSKILTDRMKWQHPSGKWYICGTIKRTIVSGERFLEVNVSCEE